MSNHLLAIKLNDFYKDFDFYDYMDSIDSIQTEEDVVAIIEEQLTDAKAVRGIFNSLYDIKENGELEDEQIQVVNELIKDLGEIQPDLGLMLYQSIKAYQHYKDVDDYIKIGADVNYRFMPDEFDYRPIHMAAYSADMRNIKALIKAGCDVNVISRDGKTPLDLAVERHNYQKIVDYLVENGAKRGNEIEYEDLPKSFIYQDLSDDSDREAFVLGAVDKNGDGYYLGNKGSFIRGSDVFLDGDDRAADGTLVFNEFALNGLYFEFEFDGSINQDVVDALLHQDTKVLNDEMKAFIDKHARNNVSLESRLSDAAERSVETGKNEPSKDIFELGD